MSVTHMNINNVLKENIISWISNDGYDLADVKYMIERANIDFDKSTNIVTIKYENNVEDVIKVDGKLQIIDHIK